MKTYICLILLSVFSITFAQTTGDDKLPVQRKKQHHIKKEGGKALKILKAMSEYLQSKNQFVVDIEISQEEVFEEGVKLLFERNARIYLQRPDKFRAVGSHRNFYYDGQTLSLLLSKENIYAQSQLKGTIGQVVDFMSDKLNVSVPIADLLVFNPYKSYTYNAKNVISPIYVGVNEVRGVKCHHLAFFLDGIDWQIWIEDGEMLVPRKFHIVYKFAPESPHYTVVFTKWNLCDKLPDVLFSFEPPANAELVDFVTKDNTQEVKPDTESTKSKE